jgi:hypothetical protein
MGHVMVPSIMQRLAVAVGRFLHHHHGVSMVAYLDDWLIFHRNNFDPAPILDTIRNLGFNINEKKSVLYPVQVMTYLGLCIDTVSRTLRPTTSCLQHMRQLLPIVPQASHQDLLRIRGYVAWLAFAMRWPLFTAMLITHHSTYWLAVLEKCGILRQPRILQQPLYSRVLYTDATPTSVAAFSPRPTPTSMVQHYTDSRNIAFAEMAAALKGLIWFMTVQLVQATTITLVTDSRNVYYTLRSSAILQQLYVKMLYLLIKSGHALVVRWVPSEQNLADPLTREYAP